ncbi:MAG: hypothetical protein ACM3IJ_05100 [Candidatus Levyibacteriota bacterium]
MAHSKAERSGRQPITPFTLRDFSGTQSAVPAPLLFPEPSSDELLTKMLRSRLDIVQREIHGKLKGTALKVWITGHGALVSSLGYVGKQEKKLNMDARIDSEKPTEEMDTYFQRIGGLFATADILDQLGRTSLLQGVRGELDILSRTIKGGMIRIFTQEADGIVLEDFRNTRFLEKNPLSAYVSAALRAKPDDEGHMHFDNPVSTFIWAATHCADAVRQRRIQREPADRRALDAVLPALDTIHQVNGVVKDILLNPDAPDHAEISRKVAAYLKEEKGPTARKHLAAMLFGTDNVEAYRAAFAYQNCANGEIFQDILAVFRPEKRDDPNRFLFIEEAEALRTDDLPEGPLKDISDIRRHVATFSNAPLGNFKLTPGSLNQLLGFQTPDSLHVEIGRAGVHSVSLDMLYENDQKRLGIVVDTDSGAVDWSVMEPMEAFPQVAKRLIHTVAVVTEAMAASVVPKSRPFPQEDADISKEVKREGVNHVKRRPRIMDEIRQAEQEVPPERPAVKQVIYFEPGTIEKILSHVSPADRPYVRKVIGRFNRDGLGDFKALEGRVDGKLLAELKMGHNIRLFCIEGDSAQEGVQRFKAESADYKGNIKRRNWQLRAH